MAQSAFLTYLAVDRHVTSSTQNLALFAMVFMYKHVFERELTLLPYTVRARASKRVPTVLSHDEAMSIVSQMNEKYCLMFSLLCGCGIRKAELLKLRIKDIAEGWGETSLPAGLARKYPYVIKEFKWQYLFPSTNRCQHPVDGYYCRHHLH